LSYLLDTNVISELVKPRPDASVVSWLSEVDEDRVFLSVMVLAEIRRGVELMPAGGRRDRLADWLEDELPARFAGRVLAIDQRVADAWGAVMAQAQKAGVPLSTANGFFAATAEVHRLTLVTSNTRDFQRAGVSLVNPWEEL